MNEQLVAGSTETYYQLCVQEDGCHNCGHGTMWTVFYKDGKGESVEIGQAWGDQELTQDVCDLMNMAYDAGQESKIDNAKELSRYKQALQTANGFLIMNNLEPVKLDYSAEGLS